MFNQPWLIYALLSAVAASFVAIFGKVGMQDIDPNLATTVRSAIMTVFLIAVCSATSGFARLSTFHSKGALMIFCSAVAGALSWLFYFKAIHVGEVSKVAPIDKLSMPLSIVLAVILLGERPGVVNWMGILLIAGGAYLASMK